MAMKKYSTFLKAPGLQPHHEMVQCHIQDTRWGKGSYPSAVMQSAYSTAPADWVIYVCGSECISMNIYKYGRRYMYEYACVCIIVL